VYSSLEESGAVIWFVGRSSLGAYFEDVLAKPGSSPTINGTTLSAAGGRGEVVLDLDFAHGGLPRRFEITKWPKSLIGDTPLRDIYKPGSLAAEFPNVHPPEIEVAQMSWRGEVHKFSQSVNGVWYPAETTLVVQTAFADRRVNTATSRLTAQSVPDERRHAEPTIDIPIGYTVAVEGAPQLPYRWDGASPTPGIPDLPKVEGHRIVPERDRRSFRQLLIAVNVAVVMALFVAIYFARRQTSPRR
jgi:hypothetical protein